MVVGKSLLGVEAPKVTPRLGKLRPGKRESRPPLGLAGSPSKVKYTWFVAGLIEPTKPSAMSFGISSEAMIELCE